MLFLKKNSDYLQEQLCMIWFEKAKKSKESININQIPHHAMRNYVVLPRTQKIFEMCYFLKKICVKYVFQISLLYLLTSQKSLKCMLSSALTNGYL